MSDDEEHPKGNGVDIGAVLQAILALGTEMRAQGRRTDRGFAELRAENATLRADLASLRADSATLRADLGALRGDVAAYHASVVGHGLLISELEDRVGRLEERTPPPKAA